MVGTLGFDGELGMVITPTKPEMPEPQNPVDTSEAEKLLDGNCVHFLNAILAELGKIRDPYSYNFGSIFRRANDNERFHTVILTPQQLRNGLGGTHSTIGDPAFKVDLDVGLFNRGDFTAGYVMIHELFSWRRSFRPVQSH